MKNTEISATAAKNEFGHVLDLVAQGELVTITKHDQPRAIVMSIETYRALTASADRALQALAAEYDGLLEKMQSTEWREGMQAAFKAKPAQLGKAAGKAARQR